MLPGVNVPSWELAFIKIVRVIAAGMLCWDAASRIWALAARRLGNNCSGCVPVKLLTLKLEKPGCSFWGLQIEQLFGLSLFPGQQLGSGSGSGSGFDRVGFGSHQHIFWAQEKIKIVRFILKKTNNLRPIIVIYI